MSETKLIDIKELKFDEHNFNRHNDEGMSLLEKSIKENGLGRSILLDKDNNIVGGNGVTEKAIELGKTKVRIIETDGSELIAVKRTDLTLDSEQGRKMALADNSVAHANLEWNEDELQKAQDEWGLVPEEWGVEMPDFGLFDEQAVKSTVEEDNFQIEDNIDNRVNAGEIWQLGIHRLMCGDSTDADAVAKLMNGERADLVVTDPPYGMNLDTDYSSMQNHLDFAKEKSFTGGKKYDAGHVDDFHPEMVQAALDLGAKETFLWGADYYAELLPNRNDGSWIVWDKRSNNTDDIEADESSDRMYGSCFELCWSKAKHKRDIARIKWAGVFGTEQEFDHKRHHPTQKPVKLSGWFVNRYSKEGDIVVDIFGGSGSTMIACEQLNRKCRMMELDPHYCDVIIARWEKLTGNKAERIEY